MDEANVFLDGKKDENLKLLARGEGREEQTWAQAQHLTLIITQIGFYNQSLSRAQSPLRTDQLLRQEMPDFFDLRWKEQVKDWKNKRGWPKGQVFLGIWHSTNAVSLVRGKKMVETR